MRHVSMGAYVLLEIRKFKTSSEVQNFSFFAESGHENEKQIHSFGFEHAFITKYSLCFAACLRFIVMQTVGCWPRFVKFSANCSLIWRVVTVFWRRPRSGALVDVATVNSCSTAEQRRAILNRLISSTTRSVSRPAGVDYIVAHRPFPPSDAVSNYGRRTYATWRVTVATRWIRRCGCKSVSGVD
jgi:hypothetical protein